MNLLIDGSSLLWRSHYVNRAQKMESVEADIYIFLKSLKSYASMYNSQDVYIAWDKRLSRTKNFRQINNECDYKGQRDKNDAKKVYESQSKIHKITQTLGCKNFYPWSMEADDIIAWLSKNLTGNNIIVTSDQDMLQLITPTTSVYQPRKKIIIDHSNFETIMKMPIEHFLAYKAILGDTSDNIKGIDGYGPVKSKKLAKKWVEKDKIKPDQALIIERNMKLMDLSIGYKFGGKKELIAYKMQLKRYSNLSLDIDEFEKLCKEYNFKSILNDIDKWKRAFETPRLLKIFNELDI